MLKVVRDSLSGPARTFVGVRSLKKESSREEGRGEMKMRRSRTKEREEVAKRTRRKAQRSRAKC